MKYYTIEYWEYTINIIILYIYMIIYHKNNKTYPFLLLGLLYFGQSPPPPNAIFSNK